MATNLFKELDYSDVNLERVPSVKIDLYNYDQLCAARQQLQTLVKICLRDVYVFSEKYPAKIDSEAALNFIRTICPEESEAAYDERLAEFLAAAKAREERSQDNG